MGRSCNAVLIVDPDNTSRAALATALQRAGYATEEASTGEEALEAARAARPAVAILETHLPGVSGYETCRELRERHGDDLPIIFISASRTEESDQLVGLLLGADDYFAKPVPTDRLLARIRRLVGRQTMIAARVAEALTAREREVLSLLADGLQQDDIAARLFVAPKTVAKHIERILGKLGVHSRAQAIALAVRDDSIRSGGDLTGV
jgi:two-component system, NarL family, nitrate/nitrite response regulator NarL